MNMNKTILAAVLLAGAAALADESYLYWQLRPLCDDPFVHREFEYAYLTVTDQGGKALTDASGNHVHLSVYDQSGNGPFAAAPSDAESEPWRSVSTPAVFSPLGEYASNEYGFMIEAYLDNGLAFYTDVGYYGDLAKYIWRGSASSIGSSAMNPDLGIWAVQVPEPSSTVLTRASAK